MNDLNENKDAQPGQGTSGESLDKVGGFPWKVLFKVFLLRVPLWLIVTILVIFGGWLGYSSITKENPTSLKPLITDAIKVEVTITTCNENIDHAGIEIRDEEKRLEERFKKIEGVERAQVYIERDQIACKLRQEAGK